MFLRPFFASTLLVILVAFTTSGCDVLSSAASGDGVEADEDGDFDECGGDRASGFLGDVCRDDCDCSSGFTCWEDDYSEQCCAEELNDLDNGVWGIDCDGQQ